MKNDQQLSIYIIISIALHLIVFAIFHFGLPHFKKPDAPEQIVTFEIVPVEAVSNIQTKKVQHEESQLEEKAKKVVKSKSEEQEAEPKKQEKEVEPKKEPIVIKEKKKEIKPEEKKPEESPAIKKPPVKKKPPKKKKSPTNNEMEALLKTLEKESAGNEDRSKKRAVMDKSDAIDEAIGKFNEDQPLSISEEQYIRQQIQDKWNVPIGVQNAGDMVITLYLALKPDGTVEEVKPVEISCPMGADIVCRAARDSAVRAVWQASPFKGLSKERYSSWKAFNINFDPKDVLM